MPLLDIEVAVRFADRVVTFYVIAVVVVTAAGVTFALNESLDILGSRQIVAVSILPTYVINTVTITRVSVREEEIIFNIARVVTTNNKATASI